MLLCRPRIRHRYNTNTFSVHLSKKVDGSSTIDIWCLTESLCDEWVTDLTEILGLLQDHAGSLRELVSLYPSTTAYVPATSDRRITVNPH